MRISKLSVIWYRLYTHRGVGLVKSLMKGYWLLWNINDHLNDKNTKHIVIH